MQQEGSFVSRPTNKSRFFSKILLIALLFIALVGISQFLSHYTVGDDFLMYYHVGNVINNANGQNELVYDDRVYSYSIPVAYFFGLLALLPYHIAKSVFIFIDCVTYLAAVAIILYFNKTSGRWFAYPLALSCLWLPFFQDIRSANSNCILLFLVTLSAFSAEKNRPALSGFFLGIATLFKLFPVAIAMVLGLKNWRIFAVCILTVAVSLLIPGSLKWLSAVSIVAKWERGLTLPYLLLSHINIVYFVLYVAVIAGATAWLCHPSRNEVSYPLLVAFAIPAVFLTMNMIEYNHLTLLAFSFVYLLTSQYKNNALLLGGIFLSIIAISSFFLLAVASNDFNDSLLQRALISFGLFTLWFALVLRWPSFVERPLKDRAGSLL